MSFTRRRLISASAFLLGSFAIALSPAAAAQQADKSPSPYSLASFEGDYAVVGTYSANVARLIGTYHADGKGNIEGTAKVNLPGAGNSRVVVGISYAGTYTVSDDGTGVIYFTVDLPGGGTETATLDLVFTKAEILDGVKVATEIATAQREPSMVVNGQFVTHISTRRPSRKVRDRD